MGKRLNDTAAIRSMPLSSERYSSVSTRKIDNGYVTTRCKNDGQRYESTETFSQNQPDLDGDVHGSDAVGSSLSRAVGYLKRTEGGI